MPENKNLQNSQTANTEILKFSDTDFSAADGNYGIKIEDNIIIKSFDLTFNKNKFDKKYFSKIKTFLEKFIKFQNEPLVFINSL